MEEVSLDSEQTTTDGLSSVATPQTDGQNGILEVNASENRKEFVAPAIGMEFESYDDAYNYYNCYAIEAGFSVRVKNSWFKRKSREKYGAVLCCSSQGFKRVKDVNRLRKETRTGCPAMVRMRLVDSKRWRILEATLEHNHTLGGKIHKSLKKLSSGPHMKLPSNHKLYRAVVIDGGTPDFNEIQTKNNSSDNHSDQLNLRKGDVQALYNYLCRMQLTNPNFFYSMDLNDDGRLRNVCWVDARARAANAYFSDVIFFDNTYLSNKYEVPLVSFVGINHHGHLVLLGCGLLASETKQSYTWLFKEWLSCKYGHSPRTIVTDRCKILEGVIADVFPKSNHKFCLSHIMKKVPEKLGGLRNYDGLRKAMVKGVYEALKPFDFEASWGFMIQRFGVVDNEWLRSLYEDRAKWAPVYLKDTFFLGMAAVRPGETITPFFEKYLHKQTPLKEFLDKYELALQKKHNEEAVADVESRNSITPDLKTRCSFEVQLAKVYTKGIFKRFQLEVEEMYSCFSTTQVHVDGAISIFLVKERVLCENGREVRDFEVLYNKSVGEVRCICSCFNFYGYLCRHALCVLNFNGVEEIPSKYVLLRWKKDYKRVCFEENGVGGGGDCMERVQWFDQLYRSALRVVEEGVVSLDHYKAALQAFDESLDRVHSIEDKHVSTNLL